MNLDQEREERAARSAEIRTIAMRAIGLAGHAELIGFGELSQYQASEVRSAFAAIVLDEPPAFGEGWDEQHRHYAEAQLLLWPQSTTASCAGFGNAVLAIEECIAAYCTAYCRSEGYPEDIPAFTELGDVSEGEVSLAARFVQSYFDVYTDNLGAAVTYVGSKLEDLVG